MDSTDRKLRILGFIENHNHDLSPSKSRHFAAFLHISTDTRRRLSERLDGAGQIGEDLVRSIFNRVRSELFFFFLLWVRFGFFNKI